MPPYVWGFGSAFKQNFLSTDRDTFLRDLFACFRRFFPKPPQEDELWYRILAVFLSLTDCSPIPKNRRGVGKWNFAGLGETESLRDARLGSAGIS